MADPHIQSPMDAWDYASVIVYRFGFSLSALAVALLPYNPQAQWLLLLAASCCAAFLHIYLKKFRLLLQLATWVALLCYGAGWTMLALGGAFVTLGGLCFKEYFCFRIRTLNWTPLFFAGFWLALWLEFRGFSMVLSLIISLLLLVLSVQKWRMPLHFDIGDKRNYQV